jgi:Mn-dependent DtxR family transcriptional regulator
MSEFGEKADMVLELLSKEKKMTVKELKQKLQLEDISFLNFMHNGEFIELKNGKVRLTNFGAEVISVK